MSKAAKSIFYFGIYIVLIGIFICLVPERFTSLLKLPAIPSSWARVLGLLAIILGGYYLIAAKNNLVTFFKGTIYMRLLFLAGISILFVSGQMPKEILLIGFIDLCGAVWTKVSLKSEAKPLEA